MFTIKKLKSNVTDEECDMCDKPLLPGTMIYINETGGFFCSKKCAENHKNLPHKKVKQ